MKTNILKFIKISLRITIFLFFVLVSSSAYGQVSTDYTVLAPLPNTTQPCTITNGVATCKTTLGTYLPNAFNLAIGIAAGLAFIMITFGGVVYATSDALNNKSKGREYIEDALWGLLLVIGAYTILYTINPQILDFSLILQGTTGQQATQNVYPVKPYPSYRKAANGTTNILNGYTLTPTQQAEDIRLRALLLGTNGVPGIDVNRGTACINGEEIGCTNIVGLPQSTINNIISLKSECNKTLIRGQTCAVTITGGTEGGHSSHGPNLPVFDLADTSTLKTYFATIEPTARNPHGASGTPGTPGYIPATTVRLPNGGVATYEQAGENGRSTGAHWHVHY